MALADNAARAASAARSAGGSPSAAAKAAKGSANSQTAFKTVKPKPTTSTKTTKPATKPTTKPTATASSSGGTAFDLLDMLALGDTSDYQEAEGAYNAGAALRTFQEGQARSQLTQALAEIDRAAIANYKGIANDYAARGMARSGGFEQAEEQAMADRDRADTAANNALNDIIYQLGLQSTADLNTLNTTTNRILADFLARRFAPTQGGN